MIETTMRLHTYHAPADGHNQRNPDIIAAENAGVKTGEKVRWIDPQGVHEVAGPGQTLLEAYDTVFGDDIDEYNSRQTRADRKMTVEGYLQSVEESRRGKPVKSIKRANERAKAQGREKDIRKEAGQRTHHELIISLGNVKPLRGQDGKVAIDKTTGQRKRPNYVPADVIRNIGRDFIEDWPKRNPNLYLFRGDFHADEWYRVLTGGEVKPGLPGQWLQGEAHWHLDFIAHADGYQRGPRTQASITKALAAMGYENYQDATGRTVTAWEQWQAAEADALKEIAMRYGYEIVPADDSREALAADEYAEMRDLQEANEDARAKLIETEARTGDLEARAAALDEREQALDEREARIAAREREQDARDVEQEAQRERLRKAADLLNRQKQEAAGLEERLPRLKRQTEDEQEKARKAAQDAENATLKAIEWGRHIEALEKTEAALQARITALRGEESDAYQDARERGYKAGVELGAASATGQMKALLREGEGEELTDEQKRQNAINHGVGQGPNPP